MLRVLLSSITILVPMMAAEPARAGFFRELCEKYLVMQEDPWPYAEWTTEDLLTIAEIGDRGETTLVKEIVYRYRAGMMSGAEVQKFWRLYGNGYHERRNAADPTRR